MNPLLDFSGLPRFQALKPDQITPAIDALLEENRAVIRQIEQNPAEPTWDNFVAPMHDAQDRLSRAWSQVTHLNAVVNNPELRKAYNENLGKLSQFHTELSQNEHLYRSFKTLRDSDTFLSLSKPRQTVIEHSIRTSDWEAQTERCRTRPNSRNWRNGCLNCRRASPDNVLDATNDVASHVRNRSCRRTRRPARGRARRACRRSGERPTAASRLDRCTLQAPCLHAADAVLPTTAALARAACTAPTARVRPNSASRTGTTARIIG
jgi:hypothetical protein